MATKKLARELGLLQRRNQSSSVPKKTVGSNQIFSYLIVIDFESTCWREKNNYNQEIIEFPAVLLNTRTGEIDSEFHNYVQPQEHPVLSEFCTELTGITQIQVEAGIPLHICLSQFNRWLQTLQHTMGVVFPNEQRNTSAPSATENMCTFLTWSDWDLGVCLQYECKRKQLHKPDVLNSWIDLRSTYRLFYSRKPKGLNGALQDLGIQFSGREHSGLDDSRNTARLAARMMSDGCVMRITRSLQSTSARLKSLIGKTSCSTDYKKEQVTVDEKENTVNPSKPSSSIHPALTGDQKVQPPKEYVMNKFLCAVGKSKCQCLISPKTLLNGLNEPLCEGSRRSDRARNSAQHLSSYMINSTSAHNADNTLVLCTTTVGCFSNQAWETGNAAGAVDEERGAEFVVETAERCGSYDDVMLAGDESGEAYREWNAESAEGGACKWKDTDDSHPSQGQAPINKNLGEIAVADNCIKMYTFCNELSENCQPGKISRCQENVSSYTDELMQHQMTSRSNNFPELSFALVTSKTKMTSSRQLLQKTNKSCVNEETRPVLPPMLKPFVPVKTSTPTTSFARPHPVITQHKTHKNSLKPSFTIYNETTKPQSDIVRDRFRTPNNVLSSVSTNALPSCTHRSFICASGAQKVTAPLCTCGRRAKRQLVSNGGPNHGRGFFCCPVRRSGSGTGRNGCQFFKWESAVRMSSFVAAPAVRSSVSLCNINSTFLHPPHSRSAQRNSY